uniref:Putative secreted protein n=1 Tax=Anopheles darlingi TaxID=43151 RepID=A0A2M4DG74_ANODA
MPSPVAGWLLLLRLSTADRSAWNVGPLHAPMEQPLCQRPDFPEFFSHCARVRRAASVRWRYFSVRCSRASMRTSLCLRFLEF